MSSFFSVIVSVYNKEGFIESTLKSVLQQSFTNFELIVINDGSTDNSLAIINGLNDERIRVFSQENKGASETRNLGFEKATSKYIALLDGDDLWESNYLETVFEAIKTYSEESVFATAIAHKYPKKVVPVTYNFEAKAVYNVLDYFQNSLKHQILTSSSIVFKKDCLTLTGVFDSELKSGEDTDLWIRFGLHFPIVFVNKILAYYVHNANSLSNSTLDLNAKPKFDKYLDEERKNNDLKKLLDKNRFSLAILSKLYDDKPLFNFYKSHISPKSLTLKQRVLMHCPKQVLKLILKLKSLNGKKLYYKPL